MSLSDAEICLSVGDAADEDHGAIAPPIYQTSLFAQPTFQALIDHQSEEHEQYVYSRAANPTVALLERKLALLERGEACKCFGSGMGAISAVWMSKLRQGDHVLLLNDIYGPTLKLAQHLRAFGIEHTVVRDDIDNFDAYIQENTALIHVESPGTMRMKLLDLEAVSAVARARGITTMIDNTWATPLFQKPILAGIDIVAHSCSKYLGGHSDVIGGAIISRQDIIRDLFYQGFQLFGSVMSAGEASLVLRGLRTLPLRMAEHERNAKAVMDFLRTRPEVTAIHHPYIDHDSDDEILRKQFLGLSGLLSFDLKDDSFEAVSRFIDSLRLFKIGVSWGGYESLVNSPLKPGRESDLIAQGFSTGMIRLSVGLEGAELQIDDLQQAFESLSH